MILLYRGYPVATAPGSDIRSDEALLMQSRSPLHRAFFRRVDLCLLFRHGQRLSEEVSLDVIEQKILRVGTGEVETVMINDLSLFLQPTGPARLTNLSRNAL